MVGARKDWENRIGRRIRLRDLHILSVVVQWGSMAKAATQLAMTQPAISDAIANLEAALSVRLLDRSSKGVQPTLYATALLKRGDIVFDELRQGVRDIEFLANPRVGDVRVGCTESLIPGFLSTIIDQFSCCYPEIVVHVVDVQPTATRYQDLHERNVDLMLGRIFEPVVDDEIAAEVLFEDRYRVVTGANSPWARRRKIALAEIINEPWIHIPPTNPFGSVIAQAFQAQGLELPRKGVIAFSQHLRCNLLATGRFLTMMTGEILHCNAKRWALKALPIDLGIPPYAVSAFTLKGRTLSPVVDLFIDYVRKVARSIANSKF